MCYPKSEGGKRCAVHMYGSRASLKEAEVYAGKGKKTPSSIFAELRKEGRHLKDPSRQEVREFADQQRVRAKFDAALSDRDKNALVENWVKARDESPDGGTFYAWQNVRSEATRMEAVSEFMLTEDSVVVSETSLTSAILKGSSFDIPPEPEEGSTPALLRDGIFSASSRTYGETYMEPAVRQILELTEASSNDHDAFDSHSNEKYEIKCCKVLKKKEKSKDNKLLSSILKEAEDNPLSRMVSIKQRTSASYSANVQNVKRKHFDKLAYVLLFKEGIQIFVVPTDKVNKDHISNWSDKHGRYDKLGESGQFAVNKDKIADHERKYFHSFVSWETLVPIYEKLEGENEEGSK